MGDKEGKNVVLSHFPFTWWTMNDNVYVEVVYQPWFVVFMLTTGSLAEWMAGATRFSVFSPTELLLVGVENDSCPTPSSLAHIFSTLNKFLVITMESPTSWYLAIAGLSSENRPTSPTSPTNSYVSRCRLRWCYRGTSDKWRIQDMEEEHTIFIWFGDDTCLGMAQFDSSMAAWRQQVCLDFSCMSML